MTLLSVNHLSKSYQTGAETPPHRVLRDVHFSVDAGEFVAVMGESGSGKTTLLNMIASLLDLEEGDILLQGQSYRDIPATKKARFRREQMGFVFQQFNLLDTFTLRDNILLPLVLSGVKPGDMPGRLAAVAGPLGLEDLLDRYPDEVSGGQGQRAAIARALIIQPKLILADEPTGALDSKAAKALLETFGQLNATGETILMVTHSALAAAYASRVLFLRDGMIYHELYRGDLSRQAFGDRIMESLQLVLKGGEGHF